jgi:hypothetical protein
VVTIRVMELLQPHDHKAGNERHQPGGVVGSDFFSAARISASAVATTFRE